MTSRTGNFHALNHIHWVMDTAGDGSGTTEANGIYTEENPGIFKIKPALGQTIKLFGFNVMMEDSGQVAYDVYAKDTILTGNEGIYPEGVSNGVTFPEFDDRASGPFRIQTNRDWINLGRGQFNFFENSAGNTFIGIGKSTVDTPILVKGGDDFIFQVRLIGDFSALSSHKFYVFGQNVQHEGVG